MAGPSPITFADAAESRSIVWRPAWAGSCTLIGPGLEAQGRPISAPHANEPPDVLPRALGATAPRPQPLEPERCQGEDGECKGLSIAQRRREGLRAGLWRGAPKATGWPVGKAMGRGPRGKCQPPSRLHQRQRGPLVKAPLSAPSGCVKPAGLGLQRPAPSPQARPPGGRGGSWCEHSPCCQDGPSLFFQLCSRSISAGLA